MKQSQLISFLSLALLCLSLPAKADLVGCGSVDIVRLMVQADRDDNHGHGNTLYLRIGGSCGSLGNNAAYIKNDHPSYNGILSLAMAAKAQNKKLTLTVNSSKQIDGAYEIAIASDDS